MTLETWLVFCATETVLCFTPGPAVLLVTSVALTRGGQAGLRASLGILAANAAYFVLSATSLGAALLASWEVFALIKWLGAAYLLWLGMRMIVGWLRGEVHAQEVPRAAESRRGHGAWWQGLVTQGTNPKSLLFFTAILPQFIDPRTAIAPQVVLLGVSSVLIELCVLSLYVLASQRARGWMQRPRFASVLQGAGGVLLIAAGIRLAVLRRD